MPAIHYVKYQRMSQAWYNALKTKDQDTLYFTYDNIGDDHGRLYLGNKLIAGNGSSSEIKISELADVIETNLGNGDLLVYDENQKKWVNMSIAEAIQFQIPVMKGATAKEDGASGLVPQPKIGEQGKFLRADGTWVSIDAVSGGDSEAIKNLQAQTAQLVKDTISINDSIKIIQEDIEDLSGLENRVTTLETTVGKFTPVETKYLDVGSAISYLDESVTELNDRLRWHKMN